MAEELSLQQALNVARQMVNHFRAFEKLEEAINLVSQSKVELIENQKAVKALKEEIEDLQKQKAKITEQKAAATKLLQESLAKGIAEIDVAVKKAQDEADAKIRDLQAQIKEYAVAAGKARNDWELEKAEIQKERDALAAKINDLNAQLNKIREKIG
jgi:chromosome segregation ATPase